MEFIALLFFIMAQIIFIPLAFTALIPPSIYDLDLDLANSCWLVTTLSIVLILPLLSLIIKLI